MDAQYRKFGPSRLIRVQSLIFRLAMRKSASPKSPTTLKNAK